MASKSSESPRSYSREGSRWNSSECQSRDLRFKVCIVCKFRGNLRLGDDVAAEQETLLSQPLLSLSSSPHAYSLRVRPRTDLEKPRKLRCPRTAPARRPCRRRSVCPSLRLINRSTRTLLLRPLWPRASSKALHPRVTTVCTRSRLFMAAPKMRRRRGELAPNGVGIETATAADEEHPVHNS